jgi:hypothetical protein
MAGLKRTICVGGITILVIALAACAPVPPPPPPPSPPPRPVAVVIPPRPVPPLGASPISVIPPLAASGLHQTVNTGIASAQITWNFRSAYNVAALNCLQSQHAEILPGYSAFLTKHTRALRTANTGVDSLFRLRHGAAFVRQREAYMTQVYNFYAFPPTVSNFCDAALVIGREAQAVPVGGLDAFAAQALPRLDAVFENFFRAYEQYRIDLAAWDARYGPPPPITPAPAPTATPAPLPPR